MKKSLFFLLPLFCLLLTGCEKNSPSEDDKHDQVITNNASLSLSEKTIIVDETFTLNVADVPEGMTPSWSLQGNTVKYDILNTLKTSALVTGLTAGESTIKVVVGDKNLSCNVTVNDKPIVRQPLVAPVLKVNADKNGLTWDAVEGAEGYLVQINNDEAISQTNPGYAFSQVAGDYTVKVIAKADLAEYNSEPATFTYETKLTNLSELAFNDDLITWESYIGYGLEVKLGEGEFAPVTGNSISATKDGTYTVHALNGYDETDNVYYVEGENNTRTIDVVHYVKLATPSIKYNSTSTGITWKEIAGATGYSIQVNDQPAETVIEPGCLFATAAGEYKITIIALAVLPEFNSDSAEFTYEVKYTNLSELTYADNEITWETYVGLGVEYKLNDGKYSKVFENKLVVKRFGGDFSFHAIAGFDKTNRIYYVESQDVVNKRDINAIPERLILEDGTDENNTDLMDRYISEKYTSDWESSPKTKIYLEDEVNNEYTEGKCARIHYWANGTSYRFTQDIGFAKAYDTLSFSLKGSDAENSYFIVRLIITKEVVINEIPLTGVYAQFKVSNPSTKWNKYVANLEDDECWTITYGNKTLTPSTIKTTLAEYGFVIDSWTELLGYFDACAFIASGQTSNGAERDIYVDDIEFSNDHGTSGTERIIIPTKLKPKYALNTTGSLSGILEINDDLQTGKFVGRTNSKSYDVPVSLELDNTQLVVTSTAENNDFVLTLTTDDAGYTWDFVSVTGKLARSLTNATLGEALIVDDFTSYTETGVGFDGAHSEGFSGLRASYYCDYYEQSDNADESRVTSPVGGPNWWLMGSNDYMNYSEEGCLDDGAARLKSTTGSRNMRYLSFALSQEDPAAQPLGKGFNKMSVMMKSDPDADRDVKVCLFAYYRTSIDPVSQQSDRSGKYESDVTIAQGSNWKKYTLDLESSKTYYGIMILVKGGSGEDKVAYVYVDNIVFHK